MLKYCYDRYKPIEMCKKSVDGFLPAIKFVPDWFKKLRTALFADDDILFVDKILVMSHFLVMKWVFLVIDLNNINLDDINFGEKMILKLLFMSDFWLGTINLNNVKHFKEI